MVSVCPCIICCCPLSLLTPSFLPVISLSVSVYARHYSWGGGVQSSLPAILLEAGIAHYVSSFKKTSVLNPEFELSSGWSRDSWLLYSHETELLWRRQAATWSLQLTSLGDHDSSHRRHLWEESSLAHHYITVVWTRLNGKTTVLSYIGTVLSRGAQHNPKALVWTRPYAMHFYQIVYSTRMYSIYHNSISFTCF